jgi:hypothetical protein
MAKATKITDQELKELQEVNAEYNKRKAALGELDMQKYSILLQVDGLNAAFSELEKKLVYKYGDDVTIDILTGEIKDKIKDKS